MRETLPSLDLQELYSLSSLARVECRLQPGLKMNRQPVDLELTCKRERLKDPVRRYDYKATFHRSLHDSVGTDRIAWRMRASTRELKRGECERDGYDPR